MNASKTKIAREKAISNFLESQQDNLSVNQLVEGVLDGNKQILAKAITLLESNNKKHLEKSSKVVKLCVPHSGNSIRIGITGVPGVGKSTFIESFGSLLTKKGIKTAVLAIDPSSNINKGSILGDKTRMGNLSVNPLAFVRPSPSSGTLGGVANATRESILLCEAAGFNVVIVETVGVGQNEYLVNEMVDFFLLLMLSGAGDEIQGIKRGIMEMADALFVNKADGSNELQAKKAAQSYSNALHLFPAREDEWVPKTGICSAINNTGVDEVWKVITQFKKEQKANEWFDKRRNIQSKAWLMNQINFAMKDLFFSQEEVKNNLDLITNEVLTGNKSPISGAQELMGVFIKSISSK